MLSDGCFQLFARTIPTTSLIHSHTNTHNIRVMCRITRILCLLHPQRAYTRTLLIPSFFATLVKTDIKLEKNVNIMRFYCFIFILKGTTKFSGSKCASIKHQIKCILHVVCAFTLPEQCCTAKKPKRKAKCPISEYAYQ